MPPVLAQRRRKLFGITLSLLGAGLLGCGALSLNRDPALGNAAFEHLKAMVAFGPRPPGTAAHRETQRYIRQTLETAGWTVEEDPFTASTPRGSLPMNNIVGKLPGRSQRLLILGAHYDTKWMADTPFVGANDGGSGAGLLLALASELARRNLQHTIWLVFFDGEEAQDEWSAADSLYGSRRFAGRLKQQGLAPQVGAFLLVDMVGDADLEIVHEANSTIWLVELVRKVAARLGHSRHFPALSMAVEDDHIPLLQAGVPSVDLIDFSYGPKNGYWHTAEDTLDKVSAQSLQVVGEVVLEVIAELDP